MKKQFLFTALVSLSSFAQGLNGPLDNVFSRDDRTEMQSTRYPWSTIGQLRGTPSLSAVGLDRYQVALCTGTLVGPNLVLTAAHCTMDENGKAFEQIEFFPNFRNDLVPVSALVTQVWRGTRQQRVERHKDWALLRLNKALGNQYGFLSVRALNWSAPSTLTQVQKKVTLAGYSRDFQGGMTAGVHQSCSIRGTLQGLLLHDCDANQGSSGGALITARGNRFEVIGISVAAFSNRITGPYPNGIGYSESTANAGVPATEFYKSYLQVLKQ